MKSVNSLRILERTVYEAIKEKENISRYELRQHFKKYDSNAINKTVENLIHYGLIVEEKNILRVKANV